MLHGVHLDSAGKDVAGRRDATIGYVLDGAAAIVEGVIVYYLGAQEQTITVDRLREGGAVVSWSSAW